MIGCSFVPSLYRNAEQPFVCRDSRPSNESELASISLAFTWTKIIYDFIRHWLFDSIVSFHPRFGGRDSDSGLDIGH